MPCGQWQGIVLHFGREGAGAEAWDCGKLRAGSALQDRNRHASPVPDKQRSAVSDGHLDVIAACFAGRSLHGSGASGSESGGRELERAMPLLGKFRRDLGEGSRCAGRTRSEDMTLESPSSSFASVSVSVLQSSGVLAG